MSVVSFALAVIFIYLFQYPDNVCKRSMQKVRHTTVLIAMKYINRRILL